MVEIYNQAIKEGGRTTDLDVFSVDQRIAWFESHTPGHFPLLVAKDNQQLLGYLTLSPYREGRKAVRHTVEVSYYVHYDHHRKGVASQLLRHAVALCPALNIHHLIAILVGSNQASIRLLEIFGFAQWGCFPNIIEVGQEKMDHLYYGRAIK
jgi:phosphinothricin acetyltransferase